MLANVGKATETILSPASPAYATGQWAIQLRPDTTADSFAATHDLHVVSGVSFLANTYIVEPLSDRADRNLDNLATDPSVVWASELIARQQLPRFLPNDTLFGNQWHLRNTGQTGGTAGQDIHAEQAWDTATGAGVVIGIVDDGLQHTHPDLTTNYLASSSHDFCGNDSDPSPGTFDDHGTAAAGVAAARGNNSLGVAGSAFEASLAGLRLIACSSTDAMEASALSYDSQVIDIYSNSWGPSDNGATLDGPGPLTVAAFADGVANGRGGLGNIYVWAAGNGLENDDNANYDGYANSRYTIAVSAIDHNGVQSYYSEPGANVFVAAYSSGNTVSITTTDRTGSAGYSSTDYTSSFGGTSSAAPLAAGVVALMLEANPNLTWRDVQHILASTAGQNNPSDADWVTNGGGYHVNHKYGFGSVNADAAVDAAVTWSNVAAEQSLDSGTLTVNASIPDNNATGVTQTYSVGENLMVERVEVTLDVTHTYRGDLRVVLTSPSGTQSVLADVHGDSGNNYSNWTFSTIRNWGESAAGDWTLRVSDEAAIDVGTWNSWRIRFYGTGLTPGTPDIKMQTLTADGNTTLTAGYQITGGTVGAFPINFYRSTDAAYDAGDELLGSVTLSAAGDLSVGSHSKSFTIGAGAGEVPLPGVGATETDGDYHIIAVADVADTVAEADTDPIAEDNTAVFRGAYHAALGDVFVHGSPGADTYTGTTGTNLVLTLNTISYTYTLSDVAAQRVRTHAGADSINGSAVAAHMLRAWGGPDGDNLKGGGAADNLSGGDGNDTFTGAAGNDSFLGDAGTDRLVETGSGAITLSDASLTGLGTDSLTSIEEASLTGGTGADTISAAGFSGPVTLSGGSGSDRLTGGSAPDLLKGEAGGDTLTGGAGNDTLDGGTGTNRVVESGLAGAVLTNASLTGAGTDSLTSITFASLTGTSGPDSLDASGFTGTATLSGSGGNDTLSGGSGKVSQLGGDGDDLLVGGGLNDTLKGENGNDVLVGGNGNDNLNGGNNNDTLTGGAGNDTLAGATGIDRIVESGNVSFTLTQTSLTGNGTDTVSSVEQAMLTGGNGNNTINAAAFNGQTTLSGGAGNDTLTASAGNSLILGGAGADSATGGAGRDILIGGTEADVLNGAGGEDILIGGTTSHDADLTGLSAIMAEWTRSSVLYADRISHLQSGGGLNDPYLLNASTVFADGLADALTGGTGLDWFFVKDLEDSVADLNNGGTETVTTIP